MTPFRNDLAMRERAAIRAHARKLRRRADFLYGAAVVVVAGTIPSAFVVGMCAGSWVCR